jgi:amino-acid N-acetyltransferase
MKSSKGYEIRKARIADVAIIQKLLAGFAQQGKLLARSLSELYTNLRDMFVARDESIGQVMGCCSLHIMWEDLAEIRSLAVADEYQGRGVGRSLVQACIDEARELGIKRLFTLTYETGFFERMGFQVADKNIFPQKIWADCLHCPKFPECDEVALVMDLTTEVSAGNAPSAAGK